jgi:hypothetical protein
MDSEINEDWKNGPLKPTLFEECQKTPAKHKVNTNSWITTTTSQNQLKKSGEKITLQFLLISVLLTQRTQHFS